MEKFMKENRYLLIFITSMSGLMLSFVRQRN